MNDRKINILLADDHHMVRESLASMLASDGQITIVGQAGDGQQALDLMQQHEVDVVVLDYSMPGMSGLATLQEIRRRHPHCKVIILTMHEQVDYAVKALEAGASGYLLKSDAVLKLITAIKSVLQDQVFVSDDINNKLASALHSRTDSASDNLQQLSPRELEMLKLLAKGLRVSDCAREMGVSESSASTYRRRIMQKQCLNTIGELVRWAIENDIET